MKRLPLLFLLLLVNLCGWLHAQNPEPPLDSGAAIIIDRAHAQDWISDIDTGWRTHAGDNKEWASPGFDDSAWETVRLDNLGAAEPGWRWYRQRVKLHENHPDLAMLIQGGDGTYALYINGAPATGPQLLSPFAVKRPIERVVPLDTEATDVTIAFRTFTPPNYAAWRLPLFMTASLGTQSAVENARQTMESARLYGALPAIAINLMLMLAGIGAFALHRSQPKHSEYQWLGLYLFLLGTSNLLFGCQQSGLLPQSANFLFSDPLFYFFTIAQIEFTFRFGGCRVGRVWRVYEAFLLVPLVLVWITWQGPFPSELYALVEAAIIVPVAVLLPILLLIWYRQGNREAGWLILPSLFPAATISLYDIGTVSILFGWHKADFLDNPIQLGPIPLQPTDLSDLFFLLAIGVVMVFRFTRVSREQARTAAELAAAREIQQRLVPASLPVLAGYHLEAAYLPAQEVGGDFYQVLSQRDGSALIVIGDVSGKGLKAAMTGALTIGALRTLAAENLGPASLLSRLNLQILDTQDSGFITCLCTRIAADGAVTIANAGHLSSYCGGEEIPTDSGLPLGITTGVEYAEIQFALAPGETLTLLSDGVVEAMNPQGQLYGFDRTRDISAQSASSIAAAAQTFGQEDDITVLTVKRTVAP
jgi:phosphoserine phosphatase RsbU/P